MPQDSDVKLGQLTRFIFTAPSWKRSLFLIIILGVLIDGAGVHAWVILPFSTLPFSGTLAFTIPALVAHLLTKR
jgi:putative membrane protein